MTTAIACVLAAGLMPFVLAAIGKAAGPRYDNRLPREWEAKLQGMPQRAIAAHQNSFEAFPLFAVAVLVAMHNGAAQARIDQLALAFIGFRVLYSGFYLANLAPLRSLSWLGGLVACVMLFFQHP